MAESDETELSEMLKEGKANHEEVLEASRHAAQEIKVYSMPRARYLLTRYQALIVRIVEVEASKR